MTITEAVKEHQYDVSLYLDEDCLWRWSISGGYCCVDSSKGYYSAAKAELELYEYLKTFKPFEK